MEYISKLAAQAALVPASFIEGLMPEANGDYVKVYLYLLLNGCENTEKTAGDLHLTEGDVKRALRYWEEKGVIGRRAESGKMSTKETEAGKEKSIKKAGAEELRDRYRSTEGTEILLRLSEDSEFTELLFIVQKYRSKIMSEKETEVFAYLYDGLHLPADVLEFLVAYSVEHDHNDIRYMEKLGKDWAEIGISDVEAAKRRVKQFEGGAEPKKTAKAPAKEARVPQRHTDYNELMMQELIADLG